MAILAIWLGLPGLSLAAQELPQIVGLRVGMANYYKAGLWTQVDVLLRGGSEKQHCEISVITPDSDGVPGCVSTAPKKPVELMPGQAAVARLITRFGRVHGSLTVELRVEGRLVAQKTFETARQADAEHFLPALESQKLIVTLGGAKIGVEEAGRHGEAESETRPIEARVEDVEHLPTASTAYEGVDLVVLSTTRVDFCKRLAADKARFEALEQWVRLGGRMVLCAGAQAEAVFGGQSAWQRLLPGRLEKMVSLRQTGALEIYSGSRAAVLQGHGERESMRVPRLVDTRGIVEASEAELPLVIRTAHGFGQIVFLAGDLDEPPLSRWSERSLLVARLLDIAVGAGEESHENAAMMHYGFSDLSGQLRSALDSFSGVELAPFWLVAALIVAYILLLGPGDYFFLRKLLRRMEWTWVTFPLIVVLTGAVACVLAYQLKGNRLRLNQLDLVDVDASSGQIRGTSWMNVFSPRMESFNFSVEPKLPDGQAGADGGVADGHVSTAWFGLPGSALGGMDARTSGPVLWTDGFRYASDLRALFDVPIQVWSTKSLTARWDAPRASVPAAELSEVDQFLTGSITNTLPFALEECLVAYGRSVYEIGRLGPGEAARLGPGAKRSELRTLLTGRKAIFKEGDKHQQEATPYDQSSTDLWYVMKIMMFYEAAGGRRYTGLANSYQHFVDLSDLLKTDRAILVARVAGQTGEEYRGATLLRDGRTVAGSQDEHMTIYRFVFPVRLGQAALGSQKSPVPGSMAAVALDSRIYYDRTLSTLSTSNSGSIATSHQHD